VIAKQFQWRLIMKNKIFAGVFAMVFLLVACGEGEGCKALSWESDGYTANSSSISFKASAGDQCENYSNYYDVDLNQIIAKIQSMKFVLNRKCYEMTAVDSYPEEVEVECPDFVPETIEFSELIRCNFGTPPGENTKCDPSSPELYFKSNYSDVIIWVLFGDNDPKLFSGPESDVFRGMKDEVVISGHFNDESLTTATITFIWTEDEVEKTLEFGATVETKQ